MPEAASSILGLPAPLWQSLWLTLRLAAITTVVLGLIGLPLAHWLNITRWRIAPALEKQQTKYIPSFLCTEQQSPTIN